MLDQLLSFSWVIDLFELIIQVIMSVVAILLLPFSIIISQTMPDFDMGLAAFADTLTLALTYMGWVISAFAIPSYLLVAIAGYYTFVVLSKLGVFGYKLGLTWYRALK